MIRTSWLVHFQQLDFLHTDSWDTVITLRGGGSALTLRSFLEHASSCLARFNKLDLHCPHSSPLILVLPWLLSHCSEGMTVYPNPRYNQAQIVVNKPSISKANVISWNLHKLCRAKFFAFHVALESTRSTTKWRVVSSNSFSTHLTTGFICKWCQVKIHIPTNPQSSQLESEDTVWVAIYSVAKKPALQKSSASKDGVCYLDQKMAKLGEISPRKDLVLRLSWWHWTSC